MIVLSLLGLCIACGVRVRRSKRTHAHLDDLPAIRAEYPHPVRPMTQVTQVTLPEARDSVYTRRELAPPRGPEFAPPIRSHAAFGAPRMSRATTTSAWTDHSEADAFAHDGSTIARTISTVSRPNSEYDLENDPGATFRGPCPGTPGTFGLPASSSFGPYSHSAANSLDLGPAISASAAAYAGYATGSNYATSSGYATNSGHSGYQSSGPSYSNTYQSSSLAGPSYIPQDQPGQQRIPAPRLLVDTKRSMAENPSSLYYEGPAAGPSSQSRPQTEYTQIMSPSSSSGMGTLGGMGTVSSAASPLSPTSPGINQPQASGSGLQRGPTIIRHADAGAFADAVPDDRSEVHLPPAYGDIYGPPAA